MTYYFWVVSQVVSPLVREWGWGGRVGGILLFKNTRAGAKVLSGNRHLPPVYTLFTSNRHPLYWWRLSTKTFGCYLPLSLPLLSKFSVENLQAQTNLFVELIAQSYRKFQKLHYPRGCTLVKAKCLQTLVKMMDWTGHLLLCFGPDSLTCWDIFSPDIIMQLFSFFAKWKMDDYDKLNGFAKWVCAATIEGVLVVGVYFIMGSY